MNCVKVIKESAQEVMENLGTYYKEEVYEEAIMHEFRLRKIPYERQRNIEILYKGYSIGMRRPDCILNPLWTGSKEEFVLEIKAVAKIGDNHTMQAQVYLNSMNIKKGTVLNFNTKTGDVEIQEVEKSNKTIKRDITAPSKRTKGKDIQETLKGAGKEVLNYLGTEFFYGSKEIYTVAVGVELRIRGLNFHSANHPLLYKGHCIGDYKYDYIFSDGEAAKIFVYKKEEEIDDQIEELKMYNKLFRIKKGFVLALPENEGMKVEVKEV